MKRILLFIGLMSCLTIPSSLSAQVVDSTVCDILANPQSYDGKIVRIKGLVIAGFEEFAVEGSGCNQMVNAIWLDYPEGTKGKAGPAAFLRLQLAAKLPGPLYGDLISRTIADTAVDQFCPPRCEEIAEIDTIAKTKQIECVQLH